jgi:acyl-CoA synthetase (AMP-forming)/AMP-acid ligase II
MNIYDTLYKNAGTAPGKIAVISGETRLSYKDLLEYSRQIASLIWDTGIKPGARVAVYLNDSADFIAALYGINMAGMVFVPVSPQARDIKLQEIISHSGAEILITEESLSETLKSVDKVSIPSLAKIVMLNGERGSGELDKKFDLLGARYEKEKETVIEPYRWMPDEMTSIFYMSDKNGKLKGIMLSGRNILSNMEAIIEYLKMNEKDNILIVKSMALVGTVTGEIIAGIAVGATLVVLNGIIHAGIILKAIEEYGITGFFAVPVTLNQIIEYKRKEKYSTQSLRYIQTGAAKLSREDIEQLMDKYKGVEFYYIYGLSEASPRVLHLKPHEMLSKAGSVGKPVKFCSIKLLDINGSPVKPGEIGELYVCGPNVMMGYYNNPELTKEVLTAQGLKTGDLAYMDEEGYVYLAGRADNMINQGGFHVYPAEIESIISRFEKIKNVKVEGVYDKLLGQKIKATVTPYEDVELSENEVYEFCISHIEAAKVPKIIEIASDKN